MKAFYDSEADALQIHFTDPPRAGYAEDVDGTACFVRHGGNGSVLVVNHENAGQANAIMVPHPAGSDL